MAWIANNNNNYNYNGYSGYTIKLNVDIDLNSRNWTAMAYYPRFSGTFDGNGHTISNLKISGNAGYIGLFSINVGTIKNVTLTDIEVSGDAYIGGLVSENHGTVSGCNVSGTLTSTSGDVGGVVGDNEGGTVTNCTVRVTVTSTGSNAGGVVGSNKDGGIVSDNTVVATVSGSYYAGGVVGSNKDGGIVSDNTVVATVSGSYYVGGLVGDNYGTVRGNTVVATVSGRDDVGGLVGYNDDEGGTISDNTLYLYYSLTVPDDVEYTVTGGNTTVINGTTYYKDNPTVTITSTLKDGYVYSTGNSFTISANTTVTRIPNSANHYVFGNATDGYTLATANNVGSYPDLIPVYALTLQGVTVTGDSVFTIGNATYATGTVTVAAKTGYNLSQTSLTVTKAETITASFDTTNHYVFGTSGNYTLATADNIAAAGYPELIQVYALTVPTGVTVSGSLLTDGNTAYVTTGNVTLSAAEGYTLQNVKVDGKELTDNLTFTVSADTTITADSVKFGNGGKSVEVGGTTGDFGSNNGVYSITASQQNSTLTGNNNNNAVILEGGGVNILTGGSGNDTFKFSAGGGIVTDYGIGSTKDSTGKTLSAPLGTDVIKVDGEVKGVYFDRAASSKKTPTFTAIVTYDSTAVEGDDTQIIVLQNINKKPTKYGSNPVYQTNDAAAATLKIWDTSGSSGKQAVISAAKLKKLFRDDDELSTDLLKQVADLGKLDGIGELNLPAVDALNQTAQATFNGGDNG